MIQPNDCSRLSLEDLKLYQRFSDLSTCLSELVTRFTDPKRPSQYQFGIGSLDLNNFEWYKFLNNLDVSNHPHVINLHLSGIHDHLIPSDYRCAYEVAYLKIMDLEYKSKLCSSDIRQTILSLWWIRKMIFAYVQGNPEINKRSISLFLSCPESSNKSSDVTVQIRIENTSLVNVKRLLTVINALYNRIQEVLDEMSADDNAKYAVHFQLQVARTVISIDDVREEVEHMQSDLQKIFRYFTANATIPELTEVLDTCLDIACGQRPGYKPVNNLIAELNTAEYRALSTFSKLLNQRVLPKRGGWCSFELPYLHRGLSHSNYCDEVQKNKYYQSIRKKMEGAKTFDNFIARINNDKKYYFKIDLFRCKEWDLVVPEQVNEYPAIFHFHLNLERPKLDLKLIQDVIAQYFAIVEYLTARYGLVEFYCYWDCSYVKPFKMQAEDKSEINRALFKAFVGESHSDRMNADHERVRTLFGLTEEPAKEKEESSETNPDTNPF